MFYAQAEVELARGDMDSARRLFSLALDADQDLMTDAGDRLAELDGVVIDWSDE